MISVRSLLRSPLLSYPLSVCKNFHSMAQTVSVNIPGSDKRLSVPTGLFINNEFVPSSDSKELIQYVQSIRYRRDY